MVRKRITVHTVSASVLQWNREARFPNITDRFRKAGEKFQWNSISPAVWIRPLPGRLLYGIAFLIQRFLIDSISLFTWTRRYLRTAFDIFLIFRFQFPLERDMINLSSLFFILPPFIEQTVLYLTRLFTRSVEVNGASSLPDIHI